MAAHNDFGTRAEQLAAALLERNGWTILDRNWRFGRREIDLVARRGRTVAFVEVKARTRVTHGHPLESIGWRKRRDLGIAASGWIERHGRKGDEYRFDAVHVLARRGNRDGLDRGDRGDGGRGGDGGGDGTRGRVRAADDLAEACHVENAWSM